VGAPTIMIVAAVAPSQKFTLTSQNHHELADERVAGRPELAIAKAS
jgi:hypothetical protein